MPAIFTSVKRISWSVLSYSFLLLECNPIASLSLCPNSCADDVFVLSCLTAGIIAFSTGMIAFSGGRASPSAGGVSPSVGGVSPSVGGVSPSVGGVSPSAGGVSPSAGGVSPSVSIIVSPSGQYNAFTVTPVNKSSPRHKATVTANRFFIRINTPFSQTDYNKT